MRRRFASGGVLFLAVFVLCGCVTSNDHATRASIRVLQATTTTTTTAPSTTTRPSRSCGVADYDRPTRSLRPLDPLPPPGSMLANTLTPYITAHGRMRVGVDENTYHLSYRDQRTGQFEGFEIDLVYAIAGAIFGDSTLAQLIERVDFIPVITDEKVKVVEHGDVDLTVSAVSITCERWNSVLFSTPYFNARTKVQVRTNAMGKPMLADGTPIVPTSSIPALDEQLKGRRVCATRGSTSIGIIEANLPSTIPVEVPTRSECLMRLQDGTIDAISTHDTFLLGFEEQDPDTMILNPTLSPQPYGIAIGKDHPEFVRFVNGILEGLIADGKLQRIYDQNFGTCKTCDEMHNALPGAPPPWLD